MKAFLPAALACLTSLLACTAGAVTIVPETFSGTYNPTTFSQMDGALVYGATSASAGGFVTGEQSAFSGSVAAGTTANLGPFAIGVPSDATGMHASLFSVYNLDSGYVSLVLDATVASNLISGQKNFSDVFTVSGYNSESTFANALENTSTGTNVTYLKTFFADYVNDFPTITGNTGTGTLVTFSTAANGGGATLNFVAAPEPSTWAALCVGGAALGLIRRRRTAR